MTDLGASLHRGHFFDAGLRRGGRDWTQRRQGYAAMRKAFDEAGG